MFPSQPFLYITILRVNMYGLEIYLNLWGDTKVHYIETACHAKKNSSIFLHSFFLHSILCFIFANKTSRSHFTKKVWVVLKHIEHFPYFFIFYLMKSSCCTQCQKLYWHPLLYAWSTLELWVHGKLIFVNFVVCPPLPRNTCNLMNCFRYGLIKYIVFIT